MTFWPRKRMIISFACWLENFRRIRTFYDFFPVVSYKLEHLTDRRTDGRNAAFDRPFSGRASQWWSDKLPYKTEISTTTYKLFTPIDVFSKYRRHGIHCRRFQTVTKSVIYSWTLLIIIYKHIHIVTHTQPVTSSNNSTYHTYCVWAYVIEGGPKFNTFYLGLGRKTLFKTRAA